MQETTIIIPCSQKSKGGIFSGILLVAGTSIGAGMLALPMVTGLAGFFPAMLINLLCWLFMLATGLLMLEATLWMKEGSNILSMTRRFLGPYGQWLGGAAFAFLYYCLLISYISGGAPLLSQGMQAYLNFDPSGLISSVLFASLFGSVVYLGHAVVDRLNWILMGSLILSYFLLVTAGSAEISLQKLIQSRWGLTFMAAPVLFSAYGYHNIIPSMTTYLGRDVTKLRWAIIGGTSVPFIVYSLWQWMIIGTLSQQEIALAAANGAPITYALQEATGIQLLSVLGNYFGFFALVTSFLGVALSMVDFFADGLKIEANGLKRAFLCSLVFLPPALFSAINPGIFIEALGVAGGFGEAILNGLFPVLLVWIGRYRLKLSSSYQLMGGRITLCLLFLLTLLIIGLEAHHLFTK